MKRITRGIAAAGALAGIYLYAVKPSSRRKWAESYAGILFAHRGLYDPEQGIPENSLPAFVRATEQGYGIELDVQVTKDGIPVIFHDGKLDRMARREDDTPASGYLHDYTLEELSQLHLAGSRERIPLFADVLKAVDGRVPLIVELKLEFKEDAVRLCEAADALLKQYHGAYVVESFDARAVYWYRKHRPEIIRGQLSEHFEVQNSSLKPLWTCAEYLMFNFLGKPDFIAYNWRNEKNLSRRITRYLYRCPNVAWTIQSAEELQAMEKQFDLFIFEKFDPKQSKIV